MSTTAEGRSIWCYFGETCGYHLTKPCLSCVVTSKTAAIHVRCQYSMCNFLSCKILQGPHPAAWDQEGLPFSLPDAYWSIKESHTPITMHHSMHLPTKCTTIYMPSTFQQRLVPRLFSGKRLQCTFHLHICHAHPTGWHIYARPLIFHILCSDVAKLRIVCGWRTSLPRQHTRMLLTLTSAVVLPIGNRLCIPPWQCSCTLVL